MLSDNKVKFLVEALDYYSDFLKNVINRLLIFFFFLDGTCFEQFREQSSLATKQNQKFNAQTSPKDLKDLIVQLLV